MRKRKSEDLKKVLEVRCKEDDFQRRVARFLLYFWDELRCCFLGNTLSSLFRNTAYQ